MAVERSNCGIKSLGAIFELCFPIQSSVPAQLSLLTCSQSSQSPQSMRLARRQSRHSIGRSRVAAWILQRLGRVLCEGALIWFGSGHGPQRVHLQNKEVCDCWTFSISMAGDCKIGKVVSHISNKWAIATLQHWHVHERPWSATCWQFVRIETTTITDAACWRLILDSALESLNGQLWGCCGSMGVSKIPWVLKCSDWFWSSRLSGRDWVFKEHERIRRTPISNSWGDDLFRRHPEVVHKLCPGPSKRAFPGAHSAL